VTTVALVTGGTGGIGRAICARLAASGHAVVAGDVSVAGVPGGHDLARPAAGEIMDWPMDVTDDDSVARAVTAAAAGRALAAVVNCAGILREARSDNLRPEAAERMWAVNVMGTGRVTRASLAHMTAGGSIVHIGSIAGAVGRFAGTGMYSATKAALAGLTRVQACELAARGIRVNLIAPGFIGVAMAPEWERMSGGEAALAAQVPLGRLGRAEEIAEVVEFLVSPRSSYVTGAVIAVDGGSSAW